jgi:pilus assembly protein CpaC
MGSIFTRISGNTAVGGQGGNSDQGTTFPYRTGSLVGAYLPSWNEDLLAVWELMEQRGKISTLAEPNLVVTHGRQASFLAGGEFPYVTGISPQGVPQVAFKEYGVKLTFTPWLAPNSNRIELQVAPEVSAIDRSNCIATGNVNLCGITKRNAGSTVSLRNGEMLVIAGILNKEDQDLFQKIPWVGDLPLIGRLFKNSETTRNQRELLVFVSPTILPATEGPTAAPATPPVWPVSSPSGPATLKKETSNTNHMK